MAVLEKSLRAKLETIVKNARALAEIASLAALNQLGIGDSKAPDYLTIDQKDLRRRLRAHGRALGDKRRSDGSQELQHLVWEISYEHWHQMLFARFLAENNLLMWEAGASVSLDDCRSIVDSHPELAMESKSHWELAGKLAARMLPQVFKPNNPVFLIRFSTEEQRELEMLIGSLKKDIFHASDSLGWVYQFWQSKRKDEVNLSEVKIGADELPAVTQLFTDPYMVEFLLQNSLGAWWYSRYPDDRHAFTFPYLRIREDGSPAAGNFLKWPDSLEDFKILDPSCGSGHFLVAAFLMLVPMRMRSECLSIVDAVNLVLSQNIFGLEIDPRCVEIAVFSLALNAWTYKNEEGEQIGIQGKIPRLNIACCGLKVSSKVQDWHALIPKNDKNFNHLKEGLTELYETFSKAPILGSLIDPSKSNKGTLFSSGYKSLEGLLESALSRDREELINDDESSVFDNVLSAEGLLGASKILSESYDLVITNVPFLGRSKQDIVLKNFCDQHYINAKSDLANVFLERCLELAKKNGKGVIQVVMPQNWLFLTSYMEQRKSLLRLVQWNLVARIGPGGFDSPQAAGAAVILLTQNTDLPTEDFVMMAVDAIQENAPEKKAYLLKAGELLSIPQKQQMNNPDGRVLLEIGLNENKFPLLSSFAHSYQGIKTGDDSQYRFYFWEIPFNEPAWIPLQSTVKTTVKYGGLESCLKWGGNGRLMARKQGLSAWGLRGVVVSQMGDIPCSIYLGTAFDSNVAAVVPLNQKNFESVWKYCSSDEYRKNIRAIDQKVGVANSTLTKVPFEMGYWNELAKIEFPNGIGKPYSEDITQLIFHGYPKESSNPLQAAIAKILGFTWPAENQLSIELSQESIHLKTLSNNLHDHILDDGVLCIPPIRGEKSAADRIIALLIEVWELSASGSWKPSILDNLLKDFGSTKCDLEKWLRDLFFEQHLKLFNHRPFIWQIWDGLKDGFSVLVNYHKLDQKGLEKLIHLYLGDWIRQQESGVTKGVDGADLRLVAANSLKEKLEKILIGERPYDIFVRWKSIESQPIGWLPDFSDGVRVNIRPFVMAEVLRINKKPKFNISWDKDRGKDSFEAPWFFLGLQYGGEKGDRINSHHLSLLEKNKARYG